MDKMMEMLQALASREEPPTRTVIYEITSPSFKLQHLPRIKTTWPNFGLLPNNLSPFAEPLGVGPSTQQVVQLPAVPENATTLCSSYYGSWTL